jgi:hypothetical protein
VVSVKSRLRGAFAGGDVLERVNTARSQADVLGGECVVHAAAQMCTLFLKRDSKSREKNGQNEEL